MTGISEFYSIFNKFQLLYTVIFTNKASTHKLCYCLWSTVGDTKSTYCSSEGWNTVSHALNIFSLQNFFPPDSVQYTGKLVIQTHSLHLQVLSCGLGGEWSGKAPTCKYIDCGVPPNIDNGRYELLNGTATYGSFIEYSCREDYWLDGTERQMCTREGKWSADTPACVCKFLKFCCSHMTLHILLAQPPKKISGTIVILCSSSSALTLSVSTLQ
jgi:hypothetical protein